MKAGIYSIKNKVDKKRYIGMSVNLRNRLRNHKWKLNNNKHENIHLQNSWNKYEEGNFDFEILETVDKKEIDTLPEKEKYYIKLYDSYNNGFNKTLGGDGHIGFIHCKERLKKMSEIMKGNKYSLGRVASEEERLRKSIAFKNRADLKEHSERGRRNLKKLWEDETFREKVYKTNLGNQYAKGFKHSDEYKERLSETRMGEQNPFYNKTHSEENKKLFSELSKERWRDQEFRDKVIPKRRELMSSDEYRKKMSSVTRGEGNGQSKATELDVINIRLSYLNGAKLRELAELYPNFTKSGLQKIYLGKTWKHLPNSIEELQHMLINYQSNDESLGRSND